MKVDTKTPRIVPLEGGHNFRDLGGYPAMDEKTVRWNYIYRSGSLADLTPADQDLLIRLGIKLICDFRSNRERQARPIQWPPHPEIEIWFRDHDGSVGDHVKALSRPEFTWRDTRGIMLRSYEELPFEQADSYRELFQRIAAGQLPLVFHCYAGKERTGVAAALLLHLLGVPYDVILEDYLLTGQFFEGLRAMVMSDPLIGAFTNNPPDVWEPLLRVESSYLDAAFTGIKARHGSAETYMADILGVDHQMATAIRNRLLV